MSTHADPSKDEYLELEKKLGAAEYELAANLVETDKALGTAVKRGKKQANAAGAQLKRKASVRSRKHDSDGASALLPRDHGGAQRPHSSA